MQWYVYVAMGLWAIWTWSQQREQERTFDRDRLTALYVNPFLSACEDLQSRIYNILELDGLGKLQKRYPDKSYAEETLYLIVRYFGWVAVIQRYSPYAHDQVVTRLAEGVRDIFATVDDEFPVGPFNFFHPEQKALGKIVMSRTQGQHGVELDTISSYEFKSRLAVAPLSESQAVQQSLSALRNAEDGATVQGRHRLLKVQHLLVDLLQYLENKEQYYLFAGERKKCSEPPKFPTRVPRRTPARRGGATRPQQVNS